MPWSPYAFCLHRVLSLLPCDSFGADVDFERGSVADIAVVPVLWLWVAVGICRLILLWLFAVAANCCCAVDLWGSAVGIGLATDLITT
jgi:hypothetical protein